MEGILGEQFYFEVITNQFLSDLAIKDLINKVSIDNCIRYEEQDEIRYIQYRFPANQFINLHDFITQLQIKSISIHFKEICDIVRAILQTIYQYHSMGFNLEKVTLKTIWLKCLNPFSYYFHQSYEFKIVITDAFNDFSEGIEVKITNYLLQKIKDIILYLYKPFFTNDSNQRIIEIKNLQTIQDFIMYIEKFPHNYPPIQRICTPSDYNLLTLSQPFVEMRTFLPTNLYGILKPNLINWIIKQNIKQKWKDLDGLLQILKLNNLKKITDIWKQNENAKKLKILMIKFGYFNSLENLQFFPNDDFYKLQTTQVHQNKIQSIDQQKQNIVTQLRQVAQNNFPRFCQKLAYSQILDLVRVQSILDSSIQEMKTKIDFYNQSVFEKINKFFKLSNIISVEEFQEQLHIVVFKYIDDILSQFNSVDEITQVFNDENIILDIIKTFYTQKVKELNKKTVEKIKFDKE